jgi:hypothetical protein
MAEQAQVLREAMADCRHPARRSGGHLVAARLTPPSRTVTAASPDCGFAHEGEEIEPALDGIFSLRISSKRRPRP